MEKERQIVSAGQSEVLDYWAAGFEQRTGGQCKAVQEVTQEPCNAYLLGNVVRIALNAVSSQNA